MELSSSAYAGHGARFYETNAFQEARKAGVLYGGEKQVCTFLPERFSSSNRVLYAWTQDRVRCFKVAAQLVARQAAQVASELGPQEMLGNLPEPGFGSSAVTWTRTLTICGSLMTAKPA